MDFRGSNETSVYPDKVLANDRQGAASGPDRALLGWNPRCPVETCHRLGDEHYLGVVFPGVRL